MRTSKTLKRLLAVALALVMVLSLSITAFAALETGKYTINIKTNANTKTGVESRYKAYQIFAGRPDDGTHEVEPSDPSDPSTEPNFDDTDTPRYDGGKIKDPASNTLSDITWGSGIKAADFVKALLKDDTMGSSLKTALTAAGYKVEGDSDVTIKKGESADALSNEQIKADADLAQAVADWLADNTEYARAFSDIAGKHLETDNCYVSTPDGSDYKIANVPGGYYLIQDTYTEDGNSNDNKDHAMSEFILTVAGNVTVYVKSDAPTVDKEIIPSTNANGGSGSGNSKGDAAGIGDTVTFRLTGTLPENFDQYKKYEYTFHDTLSTGLTFAAEGYIYVHVLNNTGGAFGEDGSKYDIYVLNLEDHLGTGYQWLTGQNVTDGHSVDVKFTDLKTITGVKLVNKEGKPALPEGAENLNPVTVPINSGSTVFVEYTATVNSSAQWKEENDVHLEYSNNPEGSGTGKTNDKKVYVYTFGLDATKKGVEDDASGLAGAGFAVSKKVDGITYYAVFTKSGDKYTVYEWVTEAQLKAYLGKSTLDEINWSAELGACAESVEQDGQHACGGLELAGKYLVATSGTTGDFDIWGLDEGTYTLSEKVTPDGYNTMDDFDITIKATIKDNGDLDTGEGQTTATSPADRDDVKIDDGNVGDVKTTEGKENYFDLELQNTKTLLPSTGGMGTTIFRVAGVVLLVGAALYLILCSRKKRGVEAE